MKKVKISRPEEDFNRRCSYKIFIGDTIVEELQNGESKIVEIPHGSDNEILHGKIQWCGSNRILLTNLKDSDEILLSGNRFLNQKLPLMSAMIPLLGVALFSGPSPALRIAGTILIAALLGGLLFTLTFWKDKWLFTDANN
jgi:hypothetical protein